MGFVLFHFTLIVLLASVLTSAACLSAYLVSRKRVLLFAFLAFLFYFFDVAWVLQDELMYPGLDAQMTSAYLMVRSYASILAGAGFLVSFWLVVCTVLGEKSRALMRYGKQHQLSEREREVLYLVLQGNDNQNIASSLQLSPSTVKVHVHNILQKSGQANRQELIRDFWRMS